MKTISHTTYSYQCEWCGRSFNTAAQCGKHENECRDWERLRLPCNEESARLIGRRPLCESYCNYREHCSESFAIYHNLRTGEYAWEKP